MRLQITRAYTLHSDKQSYGQGHYMFFCVAADINRSIRFKFVYLFVRNMCWIRFGSVVLNLIKFPACDTRTANTRLLLTKCYQLSNHSCSNGKPEWWLDASCHGTRKSIILYTNGRSLATVMERFYFEQESQCIYTVFKRNIRRCLELL